MPFWKKNEDVNKGRKNSISLSFFRKNNSEKAVSAHELLTKKFKEENFEECLTDSVSIIKNNINSDKVLSKVYTLRAQSFLAKATQKSKISKYGRQAYLYRSLKELIEAIKFLKGSPSRDMMSCYETILLKAKRTTKKELSQKNLEHHKDELYDRLILGNQYNKSSHYAFYLRIIKNLIYMGEEQNAFNWGCNAFKDAPKPKDASEIKNTKSIKILKEELEVLLIPSGESLEISGSDLSSGYSGSASFS